MTRMEMLESRTLLSVSILNNGGSGYGGLTFKQSGQYVPPDTCGAAGPSGYVETVNQAVAVFPNKNTHTGMVTDSLSHFLFTTGKLPLAGSAGNLSDPIVVYDELIGRFIIGDQNLNFSTQVSNFDIAVSKTNHPINLSASDWKFYAISTTEAGYNADYPGNFGYNHDAFVFTLNMFGASAHTQVVTVNAQDLQNAVASPQVFHNDLSDFSVRPTTMHNSVAGDPMWFVTEHGDRKSIDVIEMPDPLSSSATFVYTNLAVENYLPVAYPLNPSGFELTNNIDSRIIKSAESNNLIVASQSVGVSSTQDVAQWYAINVAGGTPTLLQEGRINAGANTYIVYPSIDINSAGQIGMTYMQTGTDTSTDFMSMWVTGRIAADPADTMETPVRVPAGTGKRNYGDFTGEGRAGDLSGINVDPVNGTFWAANEYATALTSNNWGTAIADFKPAAVAAPADLAVTNAGPSSVTAGHDASYTLTVTNNGPNAAQGVSLSDLMPAGATFVSLTPDGGNPDSFTLVQNGSTVSENATTVGIGNSDTFTLVVFAATDLANGADFSNTASVASSSVDPNSSNNSQKVTGSIVNLTPDADLEVTDTGPTTASEGDLLTYTVDVTDNGPNGALGVDLADTLDPNMKFVSAAISQGTFSVSGQVVTFDGGTLAADTEVTATITVQAAEDGNLTNSATATSSSPDPNTDNNTAAAAPTTVSEPSIVVSAPITKTLKSLSNIAVATFTHADGVEPAGAFIATIHWGDGKTSVGKITESGTTYTVRGSHTYAASGSHKISTTVVETDADNPLLMYKVGDEVPGPLDHLRKHHHRFVMALPAGTFSDLPMNSDSGQNEADLLG